MGPGRRPAAKGAARRPCHCRPRRCPRRARVATFARYAGAERHGRVDEGRYQDQVLVACRPAQDDTVGRMDHSRNRPGLFSGDVRSARDPHLQAWGAAVLAGRFPAPRGGALERARASDALTPTVLALNCIGYFLEQTTRPQTISYALVDSPVALAAWMLDHDTDGYYKISRAFVDGQTAGNLTRDHILDNITLYWLTGSGASTARSYWEGGRAAAQAAGPAPTEVRVPVGFTTFPHEIFRAPRSWVEKAYPNLTYFNEVDNGGHFAAWEEPQLFSEELR
jgi:hypothetical protein